MADLFLSNKKFSYCRLSDYIQRKFDRIRHSIGIGHGRVMAEVLKHTPGVTLIYLVLSNQGIFVPRLMAYINCQLGYISARMERNPKKSLLLQILGPMKSRNSSYKGRIIRQYTITCSYFMSP